jgi:hypothetical protein
LAADAACWASLVLGGPLLRGLRGVHGLRELVQRREVVRRELLQVGRAVQEVSGRRAGEQRGHLVEPGALEGRVGELVHLAAEAILLRLRGLLGVLRHGDVGVRLRHLRVLVLEVDLGVVDLLVELIRLFGQLLELLHRVGGRGTGRRGCRRLGRGHANCRDDRTGRECPAHRALQSVGRHRGRLRNMVMSARAGSPFRYNQMSRYVTTRTRRAAHWRMARAADRSMIGGDRGWTSSEGDTDE